MTRLKEHQKLDYDCRLFKYSVALSVAISLIKPTTSISWITILMPMIFVIVYVFITGASDYRKSRRELINTIHEKQHEREELKNLLDIKKA